MGMVDNADSEWRNMKAFHLALSLCNDTEYQTREYKVVRSYTLIYHFILSIMVKDTGKWTRSDPSLISPWDPVISIEFGMGPFLFLLCGIIQMGRKRKIRCSTTFIMEKRGPISLI
ncbi:unnamed protein product [Cuscuta campestris]|uniref:Uncharacterized protein n=1 Tax=Cuscuta campestris TaxID=132261 RepID=A0A484MXJ8_9ASTE|nr:unnamed protein product [Cuscuta campestris]VFQ93721.1 unnamed protein product [Cuscuta campestris]